MPIDDDVPPPQTKRSTLASRATKVKAGPRIPRAKAGSKGRVKRAATEDEDEDEIQSDHDEEEEEVRPKKSRPTASRCAVSLRLFLFHHGDHIAAL